MKNIDLLNLDAAQMELLNTRLSLHSRYSAITFRLVGTNDKEVIIIVHQDTSFHDNKHDHKRLREIAHETFDDIIGTKKLHVSIKVDVESPPDIVTPAWIESNMLEHKIKVSNIVNDTGLTKATVSALINNHKPLSHVTKAMFYYYFKSMHIS